MHTFSGHEIEIEPFLLLFVVEMLQHNTSSFERIKLKINAYTLHSCRILYHKTCDKREAPILDNLCVNQMEVNENL